jgi:hypothetical protein
MRPRAPRRSFARAAALALAALGAALTGAGAARADATARIVLVATADAAPGAAAVRAILADEVARIEVAVDVAERGSLPSDAAEWEALAREQAAEAPGTLAIFGWRCASDRACELFVAEARGGGVARIRVEPAKAKTGAGAEPAFAIAATVREAIWGGLLPELSRLAAEGGNPRPAPPSEERLPQPYEGPIDAGGLARTQRPWFWLEGGYRGDYAHPGGDVLHGVGVAFALSPGKNVVPVVRVGWLGVDRAETAAGAASSHRFPIELEIRVAFPIGPAMFSLGPVGRVDLIAATADPAGAPGEDRSFEVDLDVGGVTTWHLPLPGGKVDALVAVGALATIVGSDVRIGDTAMLRPATVRIAWAAGVSWSPL